MYLCTYSTNLHTVCTFSIVLYVGTTISQLCVWSESFLHSKYPRNHQESNTIMPKVRIHELHVRTYVRIYVFMYVRTYIRIYVHICMHLRTYLHMHADVYGCCIWYTSIMYAHTYVLKCTCVHFLNCEHVCAHVHIFLYAFTYVRISLRAVLDAYGEIYFRAWKASSDVYLQVRTYICILVYMCTHTYSMHACVGGL